LKFRSDYKYIFPLISHHFPIFYFIYQKKTAFSVHFFLSPEAEGREQFMKLKIKHDRFFTISSEICFKRDCFDITKMFVCSISITKHDFPFGSGMGLVLLWMRL
jgi:hypothetical protein